MHVRRTLAALAVGGGLLLGGLAAPAGANTIVVVATLGRNVPTYTSGTASWGASAQGEYVDDNYVTKPDSTDDLFPAGNLDLQGTFGLRRAV
jgi:hypothetical protein